MSEKANRRIILGSLLLGIMLGCLSCAGPAPTETVAPATASPPATKTVAASPTLSPTSTPTASPTVTLSPTPTPTRTRFPTRTPTPTPTSTLAPEAKRAILERNLSLLGCEPPCWGGITPGETSWEEALDLWQGWVVEVNRKPGITYAILDLNEQCPDCDTDLVEIWSKDETVTGIYMGIWFPGDEKIDAGILSTYLTGFQLSDVLEQYGPPSQVYGEGYVGQYYDTLWVEYADLGLLFRYAGYAVYDGVAPIICLVGDSPGIGVSFQAPGAVFQTLVDYVHTVTKYALGNDAWVAVANFSPEDFYATFRDLTTSSCLRIANPTWEYLTSVVPEGFDPIFRAEEDAVLHELLATNGGCELPCWWGITPGVTHIEEVQALFARYGKPMGTRDFGDNSLVYYYAGLFARHDPPPLDYVIRPDFGVADGVVTSIRILAAAPMPEVYGDGPQPLLRYYKGEPMMTKSQHLAQDWQYYALSPTLKRLGVPSQVWVDYTYPNCYGNYDLAVVYDELGIMVQYGGKLQSQNGKMMICLSAETMTDFGLFLTTPDSEIEWYVQMQGCYPGCMPVTLEEAAGIQPDAFYQTYVNPAATACFEVREDLAVSCP